MKVALDLDILNFLNEMMRRADQSINYDSNYFEGFVLVYFANKAYYLLHDYISSVDTRFKATDIHSKLEDDFNSKIFSHKNDIKAGLEFTASCCVEEINKIRSDANTINSLLEQFPKQDCARYLAQADNLISNPVELRFSLDPEKIIDPTHLDALRRNLEQHETEFQEFSNRVSSLMLEVKPMLNRISTIKLSCENKLKEMIERDNKGKMRDLVFILNVFQKDRNDNIIMKYRRWLHGVEQGINAKFDIKLSDLLNSIVTKNVVLKEVRHLVNDSYRWQILEYPKKLEEHKEQYTVSLQNLRDKTEFGFYLAKILSQTKKRLKRSEYKQLIERSLQASWNKKQIDGAIKPYIPSNFNRWLVIIILVASCIGIIFLFFIDKRDSHPVSRSATPVPSPPVQTPILTPPSATTKIEAGSTVSSAEMIHPATPPIGIDESRPTSGREFSRSEYPKDKCGDPPPSDTGTYEYYLVFIDSSHYTLQDVRSHICRDALQKRNSQQIQVAAFASKERAEEFAASIRDWIGNAEVSDTPVVLPKLLQNKPYSDYKNSSISGREFSRSEYPKDKCGDPPPSDTGTYEYYLVFIDSSHYTLQDVRSHICRDALQKRNSQQIQVAAFASKERAEEFAAFLKNWIDVGEVGDVPTILRKP